MTRFDLRKKIYVHMGYEQHTGYMADKHVVVEQILDFLELHGFVSYETCETECLAPVIKNLSKTIRKQANDPNRSDQL